MARSMGYAQAHCRALKSTAAGSVHIATARNKQHKRESDNQNYNYRRCLTSPEILPPISGPLMPREGIVMEANELQAFEMENGASSSGVITINVSGREYKLQRHAICAKSHQRLGYGRTRLEELSRVTTLLERQALCHLYDEQNDIFCFFGCTVGVFEAVLTYHWNGVIHAPKELCSTQFLLELEFWKAQEEGGVKSVLNISNASLHMSQFEGVIFEKQRRYMWRFLEDFTCSIGAKIFAAFSVVAALGSIVIMIIGSCPDFQEHNDFTNAMEPTLALRNIELVCVCWFTLEYVLRLVVTVERWVYIKGALQIIDLLTILPSLLEMVFEETGMNINKLGTIKGAFLALRLLRVLRVMRVFRLARYHTGLKQLGETLGSSKRELSVLGVFFTTTVLLFATSVYYLEKDVPNTKFTSIPASCWWCVITITTVGYGDLVPQTVGGQLVATVACLAGIIVLAFPITMIIENFNRKYRGMDDEEEESAPHVRRVNLKF